jgi:NAD(P)-dependent dehydrogenase (short-subunit alcohol dehydrogenase family)
MTVLITGANRGIGLALAQHYAARGQTVLGTYRDKIPEAINGVEWAALDVTDTASHAALARQLTGRSIDLLICNAGVYLDRSHTRTQEQWQQTFAVNVTGVYLTIETLRSNIKSARGKIAIISSNMGSDTSAPGGSYMYRSSKAAVLNLGRNMAADFKQHGIAIGIYHPGWVQTDMGGAGADISVQESAKGLIARFEALDLSNTGCFESYDGEKLAY